MRWRVSGVGTQMITTSQRPRAAKSVVAERRFSPTSCLRSELIDGADIGAAGGDVLWLLRIGVETDDDKAGAGDRHRQGQADIAEPHHPDDGFAPGDPAGKAVDRPAVPVHAHSNLLAARDASGGNPKRQL